MKEELRSLPQRRLAQIQFDLLKDEQRAETFEDYRSERAATVRRMLDELQWRHSIPDQYLNYGFEDVASAASEMARWNQILIAANVAWEQIVVPKAKEDNSAPRQSCESLLLTHEDSIPFELADGAVKVEVEN